MEAVIQNDVVAAQAGDGHAFARLIDASKQTVVAIALSIVNDVDASEDVAQQVYVSVWQQLGSLANPASFFPWVRQITRYAAFNYLRDNKVARRIKGEEADDLLSSVIDDAPSSEQQVHREQQKKLVAAFLSDLDPESRELIVLYYREGHSSQQVATLLGLSEANVRKKVSRIKSHLGDTLCRRYGRYILTTAPAASFTALVSGALMTSSPVAAATIASAASTTAKATSPLAKLTWLFSGAILGAVLGIMAVMLGMKQALKQIESPQRRARLIRIRNFGAWWVGVWGVILALSYELTAGWLAPVASYLLFLAGLTWYLRSAKQVMDEEKAVQPETFFERHGHTLGVTLGLGTGLFSMIIGLIASGRLVI